MSKSRSSPRAVAIAAAFVLATFVALAFTGVAQIISIREWCKGGAIEQIHPGSAFTTEPQLDSTPAVMCRSGSMTLELPVGPSVATIVIAALGAAISVFVVVHAARNARESQAP
ncbi:hypothetical protein SAMN05216553_112222 [Lentzea fradiae]|uniref:Uncharacterized protein n=1 Tax=Lentzea fradiae TaxID=200378 RepID=A0A1G7XU55_9PSEU|nr:hypothetical protein [Lentzea fradiae]SDG87553.1 hypothetical protein SAMN05216553_112222 [Lentzea fradiae]